MLEATLNGCRIEYDLRRCERADAPNVLFLHGWGCDRTFFSFLVSGFAPDATVAALDFPGHGASDEPPGAWSVADYAAQVKAFIERNELAPVDIIAHSFGGRVAIWLASHWPELVGKLVITGGAGIKKPVSDAARKRSEKYRRYQKALDALGRIGPLAPAVEKGRERLRERFGSPDYVKLNANMRATFVKIVSEDLLPYLPDIKAPTLLVWGANDTETPLWMGETMEREIPDAGLVVFEGGTHFAFLEQWRRFLVIAREFFLTEEKG